MNSIWTRIVWTCVNMPEVDWQRVVRSPKSSEVQGTEEARGTSLLARKPRKQSFGPHLKPPVMACGPLGPWAFTLSWQNNQKESRRIIEGRKSGEWPWQMRCLNIDSRGMDTLFQNSQVGSGMSMLMIEIMNQKLVISVGNIRRHDNAHKIR